jgi:hypothetical protein
LRTTLYAPPRAPRRVADRSAPACPVPRAEPHQHTVQQQPAAGCEQRQTDEAGRPQVGATLRTGEQPCGDFAYVWNVEPSDVEEVTRQANGVLSEFMELSGPSDENAPDQDRESHRKPIPKRRGWEGEGRAKTPPPPAPAPECSCNYRHRRGSPTAQRRLAAVGLRPALSHGPSPAGGEPPAVRPAAARLHHRRHASRSLPAARRARPSRRQRRLPPLRAAPGVPKLQNARAGGWRLACRLPRAWDHLSPVLATSMGPPRCQSWDHL